MDNGSNRFGARVLAFWRRRSRWAKVALVAGGVILLLGVIGSFSGENDDQKQAGASPTTTREAAPDTETRSAETERESTETERESTETERESAETRAEAPPGDNMNYRSRQFVKQLRRCQAGVAILASELRQAADRDLVTLSSETNSAKKICDNVRNTMIAIDTKHFDNQARDAEIAVDEYKKGLSDFSDFIDTGTPSKAVDAREHFEKAQAHAAQSVEGINERRAVYGLPPLPK